MDQKRKSPSSALAPIPGGAEERGIGDGVESSTRVTIFKSQRQIELKSKIPGGSIIQANVGGFAGWVKGGSQDWYAM